jgi:hypothetical protein
MQGVNIYTSIGIVLLFCCIGILLLAAVYRLATQRRQLSSGREIGRFVPDMIEGVLVFDHHVTITTGGKWCRLLLKFKSATAYEINKGVKYLLKRVALAIGTPYSLSISDLSNRVLYREENNLSRFIAFAGSRGDNTEILFRDRDRGTQEGKVVLLEFLPRQAGTYRILLQIKSRLEDTAEGSSSHWEIIDAELAVREDILPFSSIVKYPHKRVHL